MGKKGDRNHMTGICTNCVNGLFQCQKGRFCWKVMASQVWTCSPPWTIILFQAILLKMFTEFVCLCVFVVLDVPELRAWLKLNLTMAWFSLLHWAHENLRLKRPLPDPCTLIYNAHSVRGFSKALSAPSHLSTPNISTRLETWKIAVSCLEMQISFLSCQLHSDVSGFW